MTWKQPQFLWFLAVVGGLIVLYLFALRRWPAHTPVRFHMSVLAEAVASGSLIQRHLPTAAFALGLAAIVVATARPVALWPTPTGWPVVLIIDVSRSMEENDIPPSRIEAAKAAALEFVRGLPRSTRVALVTFGNFASVVVPLTSDRDRLNDGIRNLTTQLRTQLGTGLMEGVLAVTGEGPPVAPVTVQAVAVLLSDGRASDGIPPMEAAGEARKRGVRVYTVGVGTFNEPASFRSGYWGVLDEPTLRAISADTGGQYHHATNALRLRTIYRDLARTVGWTRTREEASAIAGALAALLLVTSVILRISLSPLS